MSIDRLPQLDKSVFWPSIIFVSLIVLGSAIFPEQVGSAASGALSWCTHKLDWLFPFAGFGALIYLLWLAFGRCGHIKLGQPDDKPEFSNLSYIALIFCSGVGSSLIYWAIAEPVYYLSSPPFGEVAGSAEASKWLVTYPLFHWGLTAWALYCLPAVPMAYLFYVRKRPKLRLSEGCRGVLGDYVDGIVGKLIDILGLFGVMGGVGVGLGLGVPLLSTVVQKITGFPDSIWLSVGILVIWVMIFGFSVYSGLYKGIKVLSNINLYLAFALLGFSVIVGPTTFIFSNMSESLSVMFQNYLRMSLWTDPVVKSGFPQDWTVFYWAWYLAYLALMGIFVARVSKGRTIRQVITTMIFWGSLGCALFIWVFASIAEYIQINNIMDLAAIAKADGMTTAMVSVLEYLPGGTFLLIIFMVIIFVFMSTTIDSSAFTLATMTTKGMTADGNMQPARWNRMVWALALGGLGLAAVLVGGLKAVQSLAVVAGLPMLIIAILMQVSLIRWLKEDYEEIMSPKILCKNFETEKYVEGVLD